MGRRAEAASVLSPDDYAPSPAPPTRFCYHGQRRVDIKRALVVLGGARDGHVLVGLRA